jgi:hypothetical protein
MTRWPFSDSSRLAALEAVKNMPTEKLLSLVKANASQMDAFHIRELERALERDFELAREGEVQKEGTSHHRSENVPLVSVEEKLAKLAAGRPAPAPRGPAPGGFGKSAHPSLLAALLGEKPPGAGGLGEGKMMERHVKVPRSSDFESPLQRPSVPKAPSLPQKEAPQEEEDERPTSSNDSGGSDGYGF